MSLVSTLGVRHWQRWGSKHSVKHKGLSGTIRYVWGITGMDKLTEVSLLRTVSVGGARATFRLQSQNGNIGLDRRVLTASLHTRMIVRYTEASYPGLFVEFSDMR